VVDFFKVSGSGNDFIALVEPAAAPTPDEIRAWCRRGVSLGADGLFVLRRSGEVAVMDYWNADGTAAGLCLNGTRCAARLAFHLAWAAEQIVIATGAGPLPCRLAGESRVAVEVPPPTVPSALLSLEIDGDSHAGWKVQVGVPHLVVPWPESLAAAPVEALGSRLRHHPALGPDGANVDFVRFPEPGSLEIRSYERGVEAETLACGTGVLAAAAVGLLLGCAELPLEAHTLGGFPLGVEGETAPDPVTGGAAVRRWSLTGDARIIATGRLLGDSTEISASTEWR
jgi:diaminopimelate epimerase